MATGTRCQSRGHRAPGCTNNPERLCCRLEGGHCGTMTHDYKRNGTTTLFAALNTLQGKVVGECNQRHRRQEFLNFLRRLEPPGWLSQSVDCLPSAGTPQ